MTPRLRADGAAEKQSAIYDESADGGKLVADAVAVAAREHKHVLLQFGANWCGWCRKLHDLYGSNAAISEELKAHYVVAMIDVNHRHNEDLVVKYQGSGIGIPFLVVLDGDGKRLTTKNSGELEDGDHHDPQKVLDFLKLWAPLH